VLEFWNPTTKKDLQQSKELVVFHGDDGVKFIKRVKVKEVRQAKCC